MNAEKSVQGIKSPKPRIWTPLFVLIALDVFAIGIVSPCILAGTPIYFQNVGESMFFSGMMIAVYELALVTSRFISGFLVERFSRKLLLICGPLALLVGSLLTLLAPSVTTHIISKLLQGFGFSSTHTAVGTAVADVLPKERLGEGIGYSSLGGAIGLALGPILALFLVSFEFAESLMVGIIVLALIMLCLGCLIRYEKHPESLPPTAGFRLAWESRTAVDCSAVAGDVGSPTQRVQRQFFEKAALKGGIPMLFVSIGVIVFFSYPAVFGRDAGYDDPSLFFIFAALAAVFVRVFLSKLFNTDRTLGLFATASLSAACALIGIYFINNELVFYILGIGYGLCFGISVPLLNSMALKASTPQHFGSANATFFLLMDNGFCIGAFVWGLTLNAAGYLPVFVGGAVSILFALVLVVILRKR